MRRRNYDANWDESVTHAKANAMAKRKRVKLAMTVAKEAREIQQKARQYAEPILDRLAEIAQNSFNENAAIAAANSIIDRAYGKANQTNINATLDANGKAADVSAKELDARIERALKRVAALTAGKGEPVKGEDGSADVRKLDRDPDSSPLN